MQIFYLNLWKGKSMQGLGDRIRKMRLEHNLTQKDFAKRIGIAATTMNNYERDEREPPIKILIAISKTFKVSIDWLLLGEKYESQIMKQLRERELELAEIKRINYELLDNAEKILQVADKKEKYKSKSL